MLDIHSIVPFRMCRAVAPHMREPAKQEKQEGREVFRKIVNVTSISGTMGNAGQANYSSGSRRHRPHQDAREGMGPVQDQRQRGRVRLHRDAPDRVQGRRERRRDRRREGPARDPDQLRGMASMLIPLGRPGTPAAAASAVFLLAPRGRTTSMAVREHHRRPVLRDVYVASSASFAARGSRLMRASSRRAARGRTLHCRLELDGQPARRVTAREAGAMPGEPPLEVDRPTGVQRAVAAAQQIHPGLRHRS